MLERHDTSASTVRFVNGLLNLAVPATKTRFGGLHPSRDALWESFRTCRDGRLGEHQSSPIQIKESITPSPLMQILIRLESTSIVGLRGWLITPIGTTIQSGPIEAPTTWRNAQLLLPRGRPVFEHYGISNSSTAGCGRTSKANLNCSGCL